VVAVVLVHPEPLVGIEAFVTVSVFLSLYAPFTLAGPDGAAVIVQPESTLDLNVAPSCGIFSFCAVDVSESFQVPVVVIVSVPPEESVHPLMVGGDDRVTESDGDDGTLPLAEKLVQVTVIGIESMSPLKIMSVPDCSFAFTVVPAGRVADAAVARPQTSTPVPTKPMMAIESADLDRRCRLGGSFVIVFTFPDM
jgi:hypothetical protein